MNIKQIYDVLKKNYDLLNIDKESDPSNYNNKIINNATEVAHAVKELNELNILDSTKSFEQCFYVFYCWSEGVYSSTQSIVSNIEGQINIIKQQVGILMNTLCKLIPDEEGFVLSVKLPEYENLDSLPKFYKDLNTTFSSLIKLFNLDDYLEIYSFENGSKWNKFITKNKLTISLIIIFIRLAFEFHEASLKHEEHKLNMEKIKIEMNYSEEQNKNLKAKLDKEQEEMNNSYIDKVIEIAKTEEITIIDKGQGEQTIRRTIKHSLDSYSKLVKDGTEFYADVSGNPDDLEDVQELIENFNISQKKLNEVNKQTFFEKYKPKSLEESLTEKNDMEDEEQ